MFLGYYIDSVYLTNYYYYYKHKPLIALVFWPQLA